MANMERTDEPIWLELSIDRAGDDIRISARGSRGEQVAFRPLGVDHETLQRFATGIERAANHGRSLTPELLADAHAIHDALTDGEIGLLFGRLGEAAGGPLLVRIIVHDPALRAIPWETACNPTQSRGYWAISADVLPVRGILAISPWQSTKVESAVRVLAIAPTDGGGLVNLRQALDNRIPKGEVEWLEPLTGANASKRSILERLRQKPFPHVIHFVGHGRIENGVPALRVADDGDEEVWLDVEMFAHEIAVNLQGNLQLVVLEACEGARPSAFSSAAEIVARAGVEAVVAHVWPVRANVSQVCSTQLYHTLVDEKKTAGNIALAMNDARRAILNNTDSSAESMSPVLYLRGTDAAIFDFKHRNLDPRVVAAVATGVAGVGAVVYKAYADKPQQLADNVKPDPSHVDKPLQQSSHAPQEYDAQLDMEGGPKDPSGPPAKPPRLPTKKPPHSPNTPANSPKVPRNKPPMAPPGPLPLVPLKWPFVIGGIIAAPVVVGAILYVISKGPSDAPTPFVLPAIDASDDALDGAPIDANSQPTPSPSPTEPKVPPLFRPPDPPKGPLGASCSNNSQCIRGFCVDSVCCNNTCTGLCRACSRSQGGKINGHCTFVSEGSNPGEECGETMTCNGQGECVPEPQ